MNKLSFLGIGPKIGLVALPYLAAAIILTYFFPGIFTFGEPLQKWLLVPGIVLLAAGLISYAVTVKLLLFGLRNTQLMTTGTYRFCRHPLYSTLILLILPGLGLVLNSWIVITTCLIAYILFKLNIRKEDEEMEQFFGEAYNKYRSETPEFFPFRVNP